MKNLAQISEECAEKLIEEMYNLRTPDKDSWLHHPTEFLAANVCCDTVGHIRFKQLLTKTVKSVLEKHF